MKKITFCIIVFLACLWWGRESRTSLAPADHFSPAFKKISKTDRPAKYSEFHRGIRTRENELTPGYEHNYIWKELREAKQKATLRNRISGRSKSNGIITWTERGPGNVPGRTRALLNVPGDATNNTWLAGSATGGIWRTNDGGQSWTEQSTNFPALPISSFASTTTGSVIYASTGEFISSVFSAVGNGIFKSQDKGQTWQQLASTNNHPDFSVVTRVITDPADGNVVVATTVPHNFLADKTSSIMRSTDGGSTWAKVTEVAGILEQIIASPADFAIQFAAENGVGVWKSTDAGITWKLSNQGMNPYGRVEIAISPVDSQILFASVEGRLSGNQSDLYYSTDAGDTWSLVNVQFNSKPIDFFEGQGFYDNSIACDPFVTNQVYVGGVSLFRTTVESTSTLIDSWKIFENGTKEQIFLQSFQNVQWDNERLTVGSSKPKMAVQLRFGTNKSQQAHRFFVPDGATSGVAAGNYTYQDYVPVPFEAWDVTDPASPRQLMVSFRDQNRNGFDLVPQKLADTDPANEHSREYLYIHTLSYKANSPSSEIAVSGGQEKALAYNMFPCLAPGATWPSALPTSQIEINYSAIAKFDASTVIVADGRGTFDKKNQANQINLDKGVHPDHHAIVPVIVDPVAKTFKILLGNDGGVFVSKVSADPGTVEGDWQFRGIGYNTSQFYGADKRPGSDQYLGGMQDNGTRVSLAGESANAGTPYQYAIGGDGFEVIWNSKDGNKMLGSVYYGHISRTVNGGVSWETATSGLSPGSHEFPFITKLANSKDFPERVFTVGSKGVYVSDDFGGSWKLTGISEKFVAGSPFFLDVEVSRADANIVWAGSGMSGSSSAPRNLHVSKDGGRTFSPTVNYTTTVLGNLTKLASHPTEPNTAYALYSFSQGPKILRTTDLGQSWEDISGFDSGSTSTRGFPDVAVYCLYVRPDNPDILWAGTEIGIVESLNNGASWTLLEEFPNVSVWDLKGQDNQVVIATHGRGIWTATVQADQVSGKTPAIIASGTSPQKSLMLRIHALESYDSLQVFVESKLVKTYYNILPDVMDLSLKNISAGNKNIRMVCYKGSVPFQSSNYTMKHLDILPLKTAYSTYFNTLHDLHIEGLTLQQFSTGTAHRKTLQTAHNYGTNKIYELLIRTPLTVSATLPVLFYSDIGIVEPGNDSIVVEATKNGLDWIALTPAYDATFEGDETLAWKNAYVDQRPGNSAMFVKHEVDFQDKFFVDDVIMFRFRLISGPSVTSWGWAVDYISIQEQPLTPQVSPASNFPLSVFPNPSTGLVTVDYTLNQPSEISIELIDVYGKSSGILLKGARKAGYNTENLDLSEKAAGTYILLLRSSEGRMVNKATIFR